MHTKSALYEFNTLKEMTAFNVVKLADVAQDVNSQLQIELKSPITIPLFPTMIKYKELFPIDGIAQRDAYCGYRWNAIKHLKLIKVINNFTLNRASHKWDQTIIVDFDPDTFRRFYRELKNKFSAMRPREKNIPQQGSGTQSKFEPLKWNKGKSELCYGNDCKIISSDDWALLLFLNALWAARGNNGLSNPDLAKRYEQFCLTEKNRYESMNITIPKWMSVPYSKLTPMTMGKKAHARLNELRNIFSLEKDEAFPIENRGTIQRADWIWYKNAKSSRTG